MLNSILISSSARASSTVSARSGSVLPVLPEAMLTEFTLGVPVSTRTVLAGACVGWEGSLDVPSWSKLNSRLLPLGSKTLTEKPKSVSKSANAAPSS